MDTEYQYSALVQEMILERGIAYTDADKLLKSVKPIFEYRKEIYKMKLECHDEKKLKEFDELIEYIDDKIHEILMLKK